MSPRDQPTSQRRGDRRARREQEGNDIEKPAGAWITKRIDRERVAPVTKRAGVSLIEEIRSLLNVTAGELATHIGLASSTVLGKAHENPLSPTVREKLLALKREHLAGAAAKR